MLGLSRYTGEAQELKQVANPGIIHWNSIG
jgi:hypothetical protein